MGLLVIAGAVTARLLLSLGRAPAAPAALPAGKTIDCGKLTTPPFTFDPGNESVSQNEAISQVCTGTGSGAGAPVRVAVARLFYSGPDGTSKALADDVLSKGQPVAGTGFENRPTVEYDDESGGTDCQVEYRKANTFVRMDFISPPGASDVASCEKAVMSYAKTFYRLIG